MAMYEKTNTVSKDDLDFAISIAEEFYDRTYKIIYK